MKSIRFLVLLLLSSAWARASDFTNWLESNRGRVWTSTDGRQITARLLDYHWQSQQIRIKTTDGRVYELPLSKVSRADYEFVKELATVPRIIVGEDIKAHWLSFQKLDDRGNPTPYQGKSGRLLNEFKERVRQGQYDLEANLEAMKWNVAEYKRVGDLEQTTIASRQLLELSTLKQQRDIQLRQLAAAEASAAADMEAARQLEELNSQLWLFRQGW
jgi:hypothetical protein